jgi:hypothetical protein
VGGGRPRLDVHDGLDRLLVLGAPHEEGDALPDDDEEDRVLRHGRRSGVRIPSPWRRSYSPMDVNSRALSTGRWSAAGAALAEQ